jgi:hypothetical protein
VSASEEVPEIDELAVVLVLDVDNAPSVLTASDLPTSYNNGLLGSYDSKGNNVL